MDFIKKRRIFIINIFFLILLDTISNNLGKDLIKNVPRNLENEYDNYIVLYYNHDCSYLSGFNNSYRNDIDFIINKENNYSPLSISEEFNIHEGFGIEIYFNKPIKNLEHFFDADIDGNMKYLVFVDFSNFDTSKVIYMSFMFYRCSSLKSINFSNFNTSNVNSMSFMFDGCSSLKSINLSNFDTSKITDLFAMFYGCSSLKSINLSNFNTSKVTDISLMFYECSSLESIDLSNFDMINCNSYTLMFSNIDRIKYINLYNVKNDKIISNTFKKVNNIIFVCQKDNIINNRNIYNCCNSNFEVYNCTNSGISTYLNIEHSDSLNSDNLTCNNTNYLISDNSNFKNNISLNSDSLNFDKKNSLISNNSNFKNNNSPDKISVKAIIGIIIGGIIFLSIIIVLIICIYKKMKIYYLVQKKDISSFNDEKNMLYEHEPMTEKKNPIIFIFETTNQTKVRILIDSDKTIDELIKFYFDKLKRPDLHGDQSIWFLINGKNIIPPYPKETLDKLLNKIDNYKTVKIIVNDSEDKIK